MPKCPYCHSILRPVISKKTNLKYWICKNFSTAEDGKCKKGMSSKDIISYKDFNLDLEKILQDRINILNTICLSGGKKCGTVTEYTIDEQGNILNCKIIYEKTVNVKDINIFAKDYTIMKNIDNTEVISTKKINNTTTKQNEPIQKTTVTQSTNQNTNNEKNIDDNDLNYRLYLV